jgi:Tfp pilus assembly protein PilV
MSRSSAVLRGPRRARAGLAVLEATVTLSILTIALLAMTTTSVTMYNLKETDRLRRTASSAMQSLVEDVRAFAFSVRDDDDGWAREVLTSYAPGGTLGDSFEVRGLEPWPGEESVFTVTVVRDETLTDAELGIELGMPRDLDNDGAISNDDVIDSARMLPVIVRARWSGRTGEREIVQAFYVLGF